MFNKKIMQILVWLYIRNVDGMEADFRLYEILHYCHK